MADVGKAKDPRMREREREGVFKVVSMAEWRDWGSVDADRVEQQSAQDLLHATKCE